MNSIRTYENVPLNINPSFLLQGDVFKKIYFFDEPQRQQLKRASQLPYSGGIYGKRSSPVPLSGGIYGKRTSSNEIYKKKQSAFPYSDGIYGKRSPKLPFSGGIYGKRSSNLIFGKRSSNPIEYFVPLKTTPTLNPHFFTYFLKKNNFFKKF